MVLNFPLRLMRGRIWAWFASLLICTLSNAHATTASPERDEQVAAAMIFNFARFAEWPRGSFDQYNEFRICVASNESIVTPLKELESRTIKNKPVKVYLKSEGEMVDGCHIDILSASIDMPAPDEGTLYVAMSEGLAPDVAMLELIRVGRQLRFSANPSLARQSGLKLSSRLVDLAVRVR